MAEVSWNRMLAEPNFNCDMTSAHWLARRSFALSVRVAMESETECGDSWDKKAGARSGANGDVAGRGLTRGPAREAPDRPSRADENEGRTTGEQQDRPAATGARHRSRRAGHAEWMVPGQEATGDGTGAAGPEEGPGPEHGLGDAKWR